MPAHFRLNRNGLLLALISSAFAGEAGAAAARVDFVHGAATVSGADGRERPLARGAELDNGDTVRTTGDARAQLRFSDGAYVSLQPNTEFAIKDYRFEGKTDGSERGFFGLAKGAMRTVTGLVGRANRDRYRITTPTATVGIRGTGGAIQILNDGSTLVIGTSGIWSLTNPFGSVDVPARTNAVAPAAPDTPPALTTQPVQSSAAPLPEKPVFSQGEERTPTGESAVVSSGTAKPLQSGPGYTAALAGPIFDGGEGAFFSGKPTTDATFNGAGQLTELADFSFSGNVKLEPGGSHADFGTDGILAWGRWIGPVTVSGFEGVMNFGPNEGLHYVVGVPTAVLPTTGSATYDLAGATRPTVIGGALPPGTVTGGSLNVTWGSGSYDLALQNFRVAMSNANYQLDGSTRVFSSGSLWTLFPTVTRNATACSGCSAAANGFFAGANAERAGMAYHINDSQTQIMGAAAFKKR